MEAVLEPVLLIAMAATFLAGIVRGFSGFGAAMVQAPVFALLYAAPEAVATMAALGTVASVQLLPGVYRHSNWRAMAPMTAAAWLTIPLGSFVLLALDADVMRRAISGMVLVMVLVLTSGRRLSLRPGPWGSAGTGAVSGLINGATGVGGPPVVLYLLAGPDRAATNRANLILYYTFLNGGTCVALLAQGVFTLEILYRALALWPVQIVSLWVGSWLFGRATDRIYRRIAMLLMLCVALVGLLYPR